MHGSVDAVSMWDYLRPMYGRYGTYLHQFSDSTAPFRICLHYPDGILSEEFLYIPAAVKMLSGSKRDRGLVAVSLANTLEPIKGNAPAAVSLFKKFLRFILSIIVLLLMGLLTMHSLTRLSIPVP